ncbi:MAG: ABC transporter ATP-binding protein [Parcubacteria group bacterium]|nr:ABC transporter ATP-binding protein [Parcubacteria group bacterium]
MNIIKKIIRGLSLLKDAFGDYKLQILALTGIGFLSGLLEGVGANALIPLFSFITDAGPADDFISQAIERLFGFLGADFTLHYLLIFIAVLFIIKAAVLFIGSYVQFKIAYGYEKNIRDELFVKSLRSKWGHLLDQKIGHLEKVLSVEIAYVRKLLETLSSFILILTSLLVYIIVAVNISFFITLLTMGVGVIITIGFQPIVNTMRRISQEVAEKTRSVAHFVNENVLGMKTVKAMSVTDSVEEVGEKYFETLRKLQIKRALISTVFGSFFQPFGVIFILLLFSFSYKTGDFNLPAFIAIVYLIQRIFSQVQSFQTHLQTIFRMIPYLEHVLSYQKRALKNEEEDRGGQAFVFKEKFSFINVSFGYTEDKKILSGVSFSVPKGSLVGLIGPSGAGKTTIVDLVLRLFKPTKGDILLDRALISEIDLHEFRRNVGYVSQDIHLINDTVANNIRFFDDTITDEQIRYAAKQANIYETIEVLPKKWDSVIGERGIRLSAGQRQRIVIARVLARNPQLLILDEATSALDNESEKRVQEVIENLKGKITVLAIAHRLGTVMNCDTLLVLDNGKITEIGKPGDLLQKKDSYFFKMYNIRQ